MMMKLVSLLSVIRVVVCGWHIRICAAVMAGLLMLPVLAPGDTVVSTFDGNGRIIIDEGAALQDAFAAMTIEYWMKPAKVFTDWTMVVHRNVDSDNIGGSLWWAGFNTDGGKLTVTFNAVAGSNNHDDGKTGIVPPVGEWMHVAGTWDGGTTIIYTNGIAAFTNVNSATSMTGNTASDSASALGGTGIGGATFRTYEGLLSDVRIWETTRTPAEIQDNMKRRLRGDETGLIGYWRLDDGEDATTAADATANGNDGTLTDNVAWMNADDISLGDIVLAHPETGSTRFSNAAVVDIVQLIDLNPAYDEFVVTASEDEPGGEAGWASFDPESPPTTLDLEAYFDSPLTEAYHVVYFWFRDTSETDPLPVEMTSGSIIYTEQPPVAAAVATLEFDTYQAEPMTIVTSQVDVGSTGGTITLGDTTYDLAIHSVGISTGAVAPAASIDLGPGTHTVTLTVMNEAGNIDTDTCTVTVTDGGDATTTGNVTWSGGAEAPNYQWFRGQNWTGGVAPTNPTPGTIVYGTGGQAETGLFASDWQVGGVSLTTAAASHTVDFGGNRLTVAGLFRSRLNGTMTLRNGVLQIGTDAVVGNLTVGSVSSTPATPTVLRLQPGMTFDPYRVGTIRLDAATATHVNHQNPRLDLRGVTIAGGVLGAENIQLDTNSRNAGGSYIAIDETTSINAIAVTNDFVIGGGQRRGRVFVGDPGDAGRRMPPDINIRVGGSTSQRGLLEVGRSSGNSISHFTLSATSGGDIVAYLTDLIVMRYTGTDTSEVNGTLDLSAMTNCVIDTVNMQVGVNVLERLDGNPRGTIKLPAGTLVTGTAVIGGSAGLGYGRFETSNTVVTVTNSLLLDLTGEITINMGGEPMGIDVDGIFTDGGGKLHVNFLEAPLVAESTNWAFRVVGDVSSALNAMAGSGRLTSTGTYAGWQTGVLYDGTYTYFAMVDENIEFPPVAVAKDATFEVEPAGTVWVDITEVDAGSYDPSDRTPVAITLSKDTTNFDTNQSFAAVGDHPVTVKIEVGDPVVGQDSDTATVSLVDLDPGTQANVTWLGDASTVLMERREWWWKGSWLGGVPPTNPTPGTVTFAQYGQDVLGLLEQDRQVGGISMPDAVYNHELDLGGRTLTVAGTFLNSLRGSLVLTNGTLRIGTDTVEGNILTDGWSGTSTPSATVLRPGMTLDTYRVNEIRMGRWPINSINHQNGLLDLRGVTLAGGTLRVNTIRIVNTGRNAGGSYIAMDAQTVIDAIVVSNSLMVGTGIYGGRAFIGDPGDAARRLPPDIDIRVGAPQQRGSLFVGNLSGGSYAATIMLSASSGGEFEAYLTNLSVMRFNGTGTATLNSALDLAAMTSCLIDTERVDVGLNVQGTAGGNPRGTLRLPPGTVTAGEVEIGASAGVGFGLLTMSNTAFTVTNTLTIAKTGDVVVDIGGDPTGIDIENAAPGALAVDADATLTLRFFEPANQQPHHGFRWAGTHADTLEAMRGDGRLVIDDAGLGNDQAVVFTLQGDTYVGVPPPAGSLFLMR